jgi:hypothetical protein
VKRGQGGVDEVTCDANNAYFFKAACHWQTIDTSPALSILQMRLTMKHALRVAVVTTAGILAAGGVQAQARLSLADLQVQLNAQAVTLQALQAQNAALQSTITSLTGTVSSLQAFKDSVACITSQPGAGTVPDVVFFGCNVQVVNGLGATIRSNAVGNLIVGYNEAPSNAVAADRSGSHNLVVGPLHAYGNTGGLVAGWRNSLRAPNASITGGSDNTAYGANSHIAGGEQNITGVSGRSNYGLNATVLGGNSNRATGAGSSLVGGISNQTDGLYSTIAGGNQNVTHSGSTASAISGGLSNSASTADQLVP